MEHTPLRRRAGIALLAALAVCALASCAPLVSPRETVLPTRGPTIMPSPDAGSTPSGSASSTPSAAPTSADTRDCGGAAVSISGNGSRTVLTGDCPTVTIAGAGIEVDLTQAQAGTVTVNGDRNAVDAGRLTTLTIGGQSNQADAAALGALTINGDRNAVGAKGDLGAVTVSGNDNRVTAATLGAVSDSGQRNTVTTR